MSRRYLPYRFLKHPVSFYLASGLFSMSMPCMSHAEKTIALTSKVEADFDAVFLIAVDDAQQLDMSRFKYGNPILAGEYNLDVYVNGQWFGKRHMLFKAIEAQKNAVTCFTENALLEYGVHKKALVQPAYSQQNGCYQIEEWIDQAFYEFDSSRVRIDISIPQIALQRNAQGYVDPSVWDRGINAGFLSYSGSVYKNFSQADDLHGTSNAFMSINAGLNLASWQLRHNGQWQWQYQSSEHQAQSSYEATSTYLQRAFPKYRGVLSLGNSFSNGEIFDAFGYRGLDFSSDDRMLPNSMIGYAPRIRGNAKTNAKVEVRQQGQLIYQTTVSAGNFEINDLYPTGFGGELDVSIIEANGEIQRFSIPYASVVQMLRPGLNRYSVTVGEFRDRDIDLHPWVVQGKYQQGLNNDLTGYSGLQATENYIAVLLGAAVATPIGAVSFDITHSNANFKNTNAQSGQSFRLSYSKLITATDTNLTLAAYRYSTENFYKLRDAIQVRDLENKGINTYVAGGQRSEFQMTLNQGLPNGFGNLYMLGSWTDYWNGGESSTQYQVGYSNNYNALNYGLSATKRQIEYNAKTTSNDTEYLVTLSFPLSFKKQAVSVNINASQHDRTVGINSSVTDRFSYGATLAHQDHSNPSFSSNARYRTNYTTLGGSYSIANEYQQAMLSLSGNIVAHAQGVLFGAEQGQTMVLVYAPDAAGAKVSNTTGLSINKAGYAVVPYVTPYRLNDISLDPQEMSTRVELEQTSQRIAPFAGAITKVDFSTKTGYAIYLNTKTTAGESLPFAAEVFDQNNQAVGFVAQGSMIYARTPLTHGRLTVKWGEANQRECQVDYDLGPQLQNQGMNALPNTLTTEAICK